MNSHSIIEVLCWKRPLFIAEGIIAFLFFLYLPLALQGVPSCWIPIILLVALAVYIYWWFHSFRIIIEDGVLKFYSLWGGLKQINLEQIKKVKIESFVFKKSSDDFRPPVRLVITPKPETGMKTFDINMKVFEPEGMKRVLEILSLPKRVSVFSFDDD